MSENRPESEPAQPESGPQPQSPYQQPGQPQQGQWGGPSPNAQQQPPGQQPPPQPSQPQDPYAVRQPEQPWGQQPQDPYATQQPQAPWGQQPQDPYATQQPQASWAQQPQNPYQQPGQPWGSPNPYGDPYGAPPYGAVPAKKRSLTWLWILLAVVALAIVGAIVLIINLMKGAGTGDLYGQCFDGSAEACDLLYYDSPSGSSDEEFGRTCGGRSGGWDDCSDVDMTVPANSWTEPESAGTGDLYSQCFDGSAEACDLLYYESPSGSSDEEFGRTCGGRSSGWEDCSDVDMTVPANSWTESGTANRAPLSIDDPNGCMTTACEEGMAYGDSDRMDNLYDHCEAGDMAACDDLYFLSESGSEYEELGASCGSPGAGARVDWCDVDSAERWSN